MAVCSIKQKEWITAKEDVLKAIAKDPTNFKGN
jgi:hypothetical protein